MVTKKYLESRLAVLAADFLKDIVRIHNDMESCGIKAAEETICYVGNIMAVHEARFHAKPAPKKAAKKNFYNKKHTPEKLNKLIETIRKA